MSMLVQLPQPVSQPYDHDTSDKSELSDRCCFQSSVTMESFMGDQQGVFSGPRARSQLVRLRTAPYEISGETDTVAIFLDEPRPLISVIPVIEQR
jgi:hypothetical protein